MCKQTIESHASKASEVHEFNGQDVQKRSRKTGYGGGVREYSAIEEILKKVRKI